MSKSDQAAIAASNAQLAAVIAALVQSNSREPAPRPWPTDKVQELKADVMNFRNWRLCLEAVAAGQRATELLTRSPHDNNSKEIAQAANLQSFLLLTVHESYRQAVAVRKPHEAISYLHSLAPQSNLNLVDRASKVRPLTDFNTTVAYITAHSDRHDRMLPADASRFLSSSAGFIRDLLEGLPITPYTHTIFEKYDYMDDKDKTNEEASRISAAILRLPHRRRPGFINQQVNSNWQTVTVHKLHSQEIRI